MSCNTQPPSPSLGSCTDKSGPIQPGPSKSEAAHSMLREAQSWGLKFTVYVEVRGPSDSSITTTARAPSVNSQI